MEKEKKKFALIIFGPTAVGKTDFTLEVARYIPAEIINGDSGQFYTPLTIGTAKPDWKNEPVPHHLFDIIDEPKDFSAVAYRAKLMDAVNAIWQRGNLPIIVGGSGFYLKSIFFPPCAKQSEKNKKDFKSEENLWKRLQEIDPVRAQQIHPHDLYRIKRALVVWQDTKKKPSECKPSYDPPIDFLLLYLSRDRDELYERINTRTQQMVHEGWIDEVEKLRGTPWESFLHRKKLIGYDVLLDYLNGKQDLEYAVHMIQKRTRNYSKRQKTFWKTLQVQLNEAASTQGLQEVAQLVNLTLLDRDLYIKQLSKRLRVYLK